MREITLKIPEQKLDFFLKLVDELGIEFAADNPIQEDDIEIPEAHKAIVRERIKNSKPEDYIPWEKARKQFKFKGH